MIRTDKRIWLGTLLTLLVVLPGAPLVLFLLGVLLSMLSLSSIVFAPCLAWGSLYYGFPAMVLGCHIFPSEEFGVMPTLGGHIAAVFYYSILAVVLSVPIAWGITGLRKLQDAQPSGEETKGGDEMAARSAKWLRVVVYILVAWSTFWVLFWGCLLTTWLIPATHALIGAPAMLVMGICILISGLGTFFVTRFGARRLKTKSTRAFVIMGIILLAVGWLLAPETFTYVIL